MKKILFLLLFALPSFGQYISIFDVDTSAFPTMKAKFYKQKRGFRLFF